LLFLLFNFALIYAIRRFQVNQDGLQLNGTHQLLVCADDGNILGRSGHAVKKKAEALVFASKETGLEVRDDTKNLVMSPNQNAGGSHNIKIDDSTFEMMEQFKYLGKS